jgi:hypothetical protein
MMRLDAGADGETSAGITIAPFAPTGWVTIADARSSTGRRRRADRTGAGVDRDRLGKREGAERRIAQRATLAG